MSEAHEHHEPTNGTTLREAAESTEAPELWSTEAVREHLRMARLVDAPEDALTEARKALTWLELVHHHLGEHDADGWCDDAREGLGFILGMVRHKLEVADRHYDGRPNREG